MQEYTSQKKLAPKRYFTRPQLERMGEEILKQQDRLRETITFNPEYLKKIDEKKFKFYHPLPQHKEHPTIPFSLMNSKFNGIEKQASNGYPIRIVILGAVAGNSYINDTFKGEPNPVVEYDNDFSEEVEANNE